MTMIVMTGGGVRGNFKIGVVKHLLNNGTKPDAYVGISSGALVAFLFSQIEPMAIVDMAAKIRGRSDIFSFNWRLLTTPGIFTTKPIKKILKALLEKHRLPVAKRVPGFVSYANLETGELIYVDVNQISTTNQILDAVLSSIAIPGFVMPVKPPYVDAGTVEINPVQFAVGYGAKDVTIVFDRPIMANAFEMPKTWFPTARVAYRSLDLMMHRMSIDDLSMANLFDGVNLTIIEPHTLLADALEFNRGPGLLGVGLKGDYLTTNIKNMSLQKLR